MRWPTQPTPHVRGRTSRRPREIHGPRRVRCRSHATRGSQLHARLAHVARWWIRTSGAIRWGLAGPSIPDRRARCITAWIVLHAGVLCRCAAREPARGDCLRRDAVTTRRCRAKQRRMPMRDPAKFGAETTASEAAEDIDLRGKVALVTGGSSGLGQETARVLAARGAHVILTARDVPKGEAVAAGIRASTGNAQVEVEALELGSLETIRAFARRILSRHPRLHILVNNAGVMACPPAKTSDGLELQFGSNHVGHFLATCLLAPALLRGAPSRVVSVSSRGHRISPVDFDDIQFERRPYDKWLAYGQSKTANVLFAVALERRLGSRGVRANALHPGAILTELG